MIDALALFVLAAVCFCSLVLMIRAGFEVIDAAVDATNKKQQAFLMFVGMSVCLAGLATVALVWP